MPTNGSAAILKARALKGSPSSTVRTHLGVGRRVLADHRRHVERRGQVVDDGVEHRLDALVLAGPSRTGPARSGTGACPAAAPRTSSASVELLALEVLVRSARRPSRRRPRPAARGACAPRPAARPGCRRPSISEPRSSRVDDRLHLDQVDRRRGSVSSTPIGIWIGTGFAPSRSRDHLDAAPEVGADPVELVDEADPRHAGSGRPGARPSRTAARRRPRRRRRRPRRRARAGCARPRR